MPSCSAGSNGGRISCAPFILQIVQSTQGNLLCIGLVDQGQVFHEWLDILVRDEFRRIADLVHDATLDLCFWEYCINGISKACEPIYEYDHDIFYAAILDLIQDTQPVLCALISANPHAQDFPRPV